MPLLLLKVGMPMNKPSMKKSVILTFADISAQVENNLILMTPFGLICGKVSDAEVPTEEDLNKISGLATVEEGAAVTATILNAARHNYGESPVVGTDGYLALTDVTVKSPSGKNFKIGNLVVFYDQIIGITLGNFTE